MPSAAPVIPNKMRRRGWGRGGGIGSMPAPASTNIETLEGRLWERLQPRMTSVWQIAGSGRLFAVARGSLSRSDSRASLVLLQHEQRSIGACCVQHRIRLNEVLVRG